MNAKDIHKWWKFDDNQQPLSSWHDREEFIKAYEESHSKTRVPTVEEIAKIIKESDRSIYNDANFHWINCLAISKAIVSHLKES